LVEAALEEQNKEQKGEQIKK